MIEGPNDMVQALDALDRRIINTLQRGFPLTMRPYADAARELDTDEAALLARIESLLARGVLTRFGPLFQIERAGGRFVLCACHAPAERLDAVVAAINAHPEVAHNYERTHHLNIWFVLAVEQGDAVSAALARIQADAGVKVLAFPKEREFYVNLYLPVPEAGTDSLSFWGSAGVGTDNGQSGALDEGASIVAPAPVLPQGERQLLPSDRALIRATQAGLPRVPAPYQALGDALGWSERQVIGHFETMRASGLLRRIGAVPNHYRLGWRANGMTVWDVDDARIEALGQRIGALPFVSHCYQRPRHLPGWPYNLFAMVHAHTREGAAPQVAQIRELLGSACRAHDVLWSTRILKKTGLRLARDGSQGN